MQKIPFFTPIIGYHNYPKLAERADALFYFGGQKARIILWHRSIWTEKAELIEGSTADSAAIRRKVHLLAAWTLISSLTLYAAYQGALHGIHSVALTAFCVIGLSPLLLVTAAMMIKIVTRFFYPVERANQEEMAELQLKAELEQGIEIAPEVIDQLKIILPALRYTKSPEKIGSKPGLEAVQITWLAPKVFELSSAPGIVFKAGSAHNSDVRGRFQRTLRVKRIYTECQCNPDLLIFPQTKYLHVIDDWSLDVIAEQKFAIDSASGRQLALYRAHADNLELDQAIQEYAKLVIKAGLSDVKPDNNPLYLEGGCIQILLADIDETNGPYTGMFGSVRRDELDAPAKRNVHRTGLIGCLFSERQIDITLAQFRQTERYAAEYNESILAARKAKRLAEIAFYDELEAQYNTLGIIENPTKPLEVNCKNLVDPTTRSPIPIRLSFCKNLTSWEEIVSYYILEFNQSIAKADPRGTIQSRRFLHLEYGNQEEIENFMPIANALKKTKQIFDIQIHERFLWLQA